MIEVIINGTSIDLISKGVEYTKQANDLADISTVNASFTYTITADKTPKNTQVFQQLGMIGDTSRTPYVKNTVQLMDNGSVLIEKGMATVKETTTDYKLFIQDGIVEVFKAMENKTLGKNLNLLELQHNKNSETIINSWEGNTPYRYLVADYNGKTNNGDSIDVQYQIPSVNIKYLWDKMFEYLGYTYSGNFDFIEDKWMTYPKPPEVEEDSKSISFEGFKTGYNGPWNNNYKSWDSSGPNPLEDVVLLNSNGKKWKIKVNVTGNYQITLKPQGSFRVDFWPYEDANILYKVNLLIDGEVVDFAVSNGEEKTVTKNIQSDSIVELDIVLADSLDIDFKYNGQRQLYDTGKYSIDRLNINTLQLVLENTGRESLDFGSVLSDFSMIDFFKEIMFRGGLTPYVDNIMRHIYFDSLKERLRTDSDHVNDLSGKYVGRVSETYSFGTYAQKNQLTLKYNNIEDNYYNGSIYVENRNVDESKILFASKFYAPEQKPATVKLSNISEAQVPVVKLWEQETKEDDEGNQIINYKPLNNRFYWLSATRINGSIKINDAIASGYYLAGLNGTSMGDVVQSKYSELHRIFTDTRIHKIELALSAYDFQTLDLRKLHYIEQEAQFYILNKVKWETGQIAKGEFLRVKKV